MLPGGEFEKGGHARQLVCSVSLVCCVATRYLPAPQGVHLTSVCPVEIPNLPAPQSEKQSLDANDPGGDLGLSIGQSLHAVAPVELKNLPAPHRHASVHRHYPIHLPGKYGIPGTGTCTACVASKYKSTEDKSHMRTEQGSYIHTYIYIERELLRSDSTFRK